MIQPLDSYIARLQNLPPFNIWRINEDGSIEPWYEVTGALIQDVVIREDRLALDVCTASSQMMHWGRFVGITERVWEIEERRLRVWKAKKYLELALPPSDPEKAAGWKKPSDSVIEATYRTDPEYDTLYRRVDRAREAHTSAKLYFEAFTAKRDMLRATVRRYSENGQPTMSV